MGQHQDKKMRKEIRKEAKRIVKRNADVLRKHLKPKPSWIPWKVWMWGIGFFIDYKGMNSKD